jgi:hypothetical protein
MDTMGLTSDNGGQSQTRGEMTTDAMGLQQSLERKFKNSSRIYRSYIPFGKYNAKIDFHIYQSYP